MTLTVVPADVLGEGFWTSCFDISFLRAARLRTFPFLLLRSSIFFHSSASVLLLSLLSLRAGWQRHRLLPSLSSSFFSLYSLFSFDHDLVAGLLAFLPLFVKPER